MLKITCAVFALNMIAGTIQGQTRYHVPPEVVAQLEGQRQLVAKAEPTGNPAFAIFSQRLHELEILARRGVGAPDCAEWDETGTALIEWERCGVAPTRTFTPSPTPTTPGWLDFLR